MSYTPIEQRQYIYIQGVNGTLSLHSSKKSAAHKLSIHTRTLTRKLNEGEPTYFKGYKIGYISPNK